MNTRLYMLDASNETQAAAKVLQDKFAKQMEPVAFAKDDKDCFAEVRGIEEMANTAWLGHADRSMIGDYNADSFAKKFDKEFTAKFKDKTVVQNIYIVGCEAAFQADGKTSMAQKIADELFAKGYTNVCVRAVSNKPNSGYAGMRVEVVTKVGMGVGAKVGDVNAYQLTAEQEKKLATLFKQIEVAAEKLTALQQARYKKLNAAAKKRVDTAKNAEKALKDLRSQPEMEEDKTIIAERDAAEKQIQDIKFEAMKDQSVLLTSNIRLELNKPAHQFLPQAVKKNKVVDPKEVALQKINERVLELRSQGKKEKDVKILEELYQEMQRDQAGHWQDIAKQYLEKHFSGFLRVNSTTKEMLDEIVKGEPEAVKAAAPSSSKGSLLQRASAAIGVKADMPAAMREAMHAIDDFITILKKEEANKPWKKLSNLFPLKDYKIHKLEELKNNLKQYYTDNGSSKEKLAEWLDVVKQAQTDKRLIKSRFSHRTENLLTNIIDGHPRKGILSPKDKADEWKVQDRDKGKNTKRFI